MSHKKNILSLFGENELKVSRLYKLYAQKNPARKIFWGKIAEEEVIHAEILREAVEENGGKNHFEETPYSRSVINYVSRFVDKEIKKAIEGEITPLGAIENALRLEQSMIEKKSFDMFSTQNSKVRRVMQKLNRETQKHIKELKKELKKANESKK